MSDIDIVSSFVEGAPPGELSSVIADIESLTSSRPQLVHELEPAFQKYNEEQFTTTQLPGSSQVVIVSAYSSLGHGRYYDPGSATSFAYNHRTQKASDVQSHSIEGAQADLVKSILKSLSTYVADHYERPAFGVYPTENDSKVAILISSSKYSPQNFWNGLWRSLYLYDPSTDSLQGSIRIDVHYYEDGNVRLLTEKPVSVSLSSATGASITKEIAALEKKYQEELNRSFLSLSEGAFKSLRRQLPVTRQKVEWDKISSYRIGQDLTSNAGRR